MSYIDRTYAQWIWSPDPSQPLLSGSKPVLLTGRPAYFITGRSIGFYNTDVTLQDVIFLSGDSPTFAPRPHVTNGIGLLGTNVLGRLAILLDAPGGAGRIFTSRLTDQEVAALGFSNKHAAPLRRDSLGHYLTDVVVDGKSYTLTLDTGSRITVLDDVPAPPGPAPDLETVRTLYGNAAVMPAAAHALELGGWELRSPEVYHLASGPTGAQSFADRLGFNTLMRFKHVLIDFPNEKVYFGAPVNSSQASSTADSENEAPHEPDVDSPKK